jgi:hypothetical protein
MSAPQFLSGDKRGIDEFLARFDVCPQLALPALPVLVLTPRQVFLFDCDGTRQRLQRPSLCLLAADVILYNSQRLADCDEE